MTNYEIFKESIEVLYYLTAPVIAFCAWRALRQIQMGAEQVKAIRDTARMTAQREALKIAAEQTIGFAETFVPLWNEFSGLRQKGSYPILSKVKVEESWPDIQCHFHDLPGMLKEIGANESLVIRICNRMEGFAMYFACGVADGDKAYRPVASIFCEAARTFLPYLVFANERENQFSYTLSVYSAWAMRRFSEDTTKEIAKKSDTLSKIRVPDIHPIGTKPAQQAVRGNAGHV